MQSLSTALTRYLRSHGLWAWSHIDNFLCAYPDPHFLTRILDLFLSQLNRSGMCINSKDTVLTPARCISFLGFSISILANTVSHLPSRVTDTTHLLDTIHDQLPVSYLRRAAGLLSFYLSLYGNGYSILSSLFHAAHTTSPFPPAWSRTLSFVWRHLPHHQPLWWDPPTCEVYADVCLT